jgi:hypothetical protein
MRSGWPHTQDDHGRLPEERRSAPFGPDISWPTGYSDLEYRDGDYRYQSPSGGQPYGAQPSAAPSMSMGEHPYAAFGNPGYGSDAGYASSSIDDFGYGDPGYSNLGYDGPASEDAGVPGTRTVRGFVEPGRPDAGYPQHFGQEYRDPGHIELAYPAPETYREPGDYQPPDVYREPWDYEQPLRYEGEEPRYPAQSAPAYDPADYNGSAYSRPGIDGPGYDLSGIIGTDDFEAFTYEEPGHDRLAYDDPRYQDGPGYNGSRYDGPRFDETRLDSLWLSGGEDFRSDAGYGNDGFGGEATDRSGYSEPRNDGGAGSTIWDAGSHRDQRLDETRLDLAADARGRMTRMDLPVYDETRIDNLRALGPAAADRWPAATNLLAPPQDRPLDWAEQTSLDTFSDWAEQTSLDTFGGLDLDEDMPPVGAPAAFVRPDERDEDDDAAKRAAGRRRGRSGDRRQWVALSAIAVLAAGAIGGVLMKYAFHGPSGPAHTVVAPNQAGAFKRMPNLEKQMQVRQLAENQIKSSSGQATGVKYAVYQDGSSAPGSNPQVFMFVGGHLANASPPTSITNFTQTYPGAKIVPAGGLGGEAACAEATSNGQAMSMCVWFDNDSFGELMSSTMTPAKLATTMGAVRPSLEHYANQ